MTFATYYTITVIIAMTIALALELAGADFILFGALAILLLGGIVTPTEALSVETLVEMLVESLWDWAAERFQGSRANRK